MQNGLWLTTENPGIVFENTEVGRLKKKIWDASEEEIDKILEDYGIPSLPELGKPGTYIQTTVRQQVIENRRKNDIVLIPLGCTEKHGRHTISGLDTLVVTQIL
ncbi:MAG TPA: creatininase family protein [bacterium]|nr:creatininase family protein [bacterium]